MRRLATIVFALTVSIAAFAQEVAPANEAHPFLRWSRDPALSGLAGAGMTLPGISPAFAAFSNPAAIPMMEGLGAVKASYGYYSPSMVGSSNIAVGAAFKPAKRFGLAVGYAHQFGYDKIDGFGPHDFIIGGSLAFGAGDHFSMGANFRYSRSMLMKNLSVAVFSTDIMAQIRFGGFTGAVGVRSVGKPLDKDDKSKIPSSAAASFSYHYVTGIHSIDAALDGDFYFTKNWGVAAGFSYGVKDIAFVRVGYRYASERAAVPSHLAVGVGGKYKGMTLDVSYITLNKIIGNSFQLAFGYSF
ncbi:MAG: hypothetical protein IKP46_05485 [Bacteroidales bacterium]|nr:hypothetical protein [Bacteroidales bacterium]